jgi:hypothetical protein
LNTSIGIVVKELLHEFPSTKSRTLARLLFERHPEYFTSVEAARSSIRYFRGTSGSRHRRQLSAESFIPRLEIPPNEHESYEPFEIPPNRFPIAVAGDVHFPFHDEDALEIFFERAYNIAAKTILLNGDWLDCYQTSRFICDPRERNINEELNLFEEILSNAKKSFPTADFVFKFGNHEERWDNYLMQHAPEIFKVPEMHLQGLLEKKLPFLKVVSNKRLIKALSLFIIHGHEYTFAISNPVSPARGLLLRAKKSSICSHFHQTSESSENGIDGKVTVAWSTGCLCDLHPTYMPLNKWNLGFAEIISEDNFSYEVRNRKIINYRLV